MLKFCSLKQDQQGDLEAGTFTGDMGNACAHQA
jgi:hypothetical protein